MRKTQTSWIIFCLEKFSSWNSLLWKKNCKIAKLFLAIGSGLSILYASWMRNDCLWVKFIEYCDTHTSSSATMCDLLVILWRLLWLEETTSALNVPLLLLNCMKTKKIAFYALFRCFLPHRIYKLPYVCSYALFSKSNKRWFNLNLIWTFVHDACHYDKNKTNKNPIFFSVLLHFFIPREIR